TYPYGDTYEPGVCIDAAWLEAHGRTAMDVTDTASRSCHGTVPPFDQVYDLSGSVTEWQDVCYDQGIAGWLCLMSGTPWNHDPAANLACDGYGGSVEMQRLNADRGIRCCADTER
ncbi:MAG: hypothetical protein OZ921_13455, partial [Sorangiineae bacterium]|nr:hypothetical protein [Polyangiaceae bacterium]MEB2323512.1 hypothetical protein [Sorangiineae bacterium]